MANAVRIVTPQPDLERLRAGWIRQEVRLFVAKSDSRFSGGIHAVRPAVDCHDRETKETTPEPTSRQPPQAARRADILAGDDRRRFAARQAADAGVPVRLEFATDYEEAVLSGLLDHFLHSATLQVPIEPFYSLAAGHRPIAQADALAGVRQYPGRCLFVDAQRRVSLSRWWAERGVFLGTTRR